MHKANNSSSDVCYCLSSSVCSFLSSLLSCLVNVSIISLCSQGIYEQRLRGHSFQQVNGGDQRMRAGSFQLYPTPQQQQQQQQMAATMQQQVISYILFRHLIDCAYACLFACMSIYSPLLHILVQPIFFLILHLYYCPTECIARCRRFVVLSRGGKRHDASLRRQTGIRISIPPLPFFVILLTAQQ